MHSDLFTYLLKSRIIMLNMAGVLKHKLDIWRSISVANTLLQGSYKFRKVFFEFGQNKSKNMLHSGYGNSQHFGDKLFINKLIKI